MHIIFGLAAAIAAVYFFVMRARNTADMAGELLEAGNDVRLAARRFGFKRKTKFTPFKVLKTLA